MGSGIAKLILVEAPAGYGKTRSLRQHARAYERVIVATTARDVADALASASCDDAIVVDDLDRWASSDQLALADQLAYQRSDAALLIGTRWCHRRLADVLTSLGAVRVDISCLRVEFEAVGELFGDTHTDEQLASFTEAIDGWPVLAHTIALETITTPTPVSAATLQPAVIRVVHEHVAELNEGDRVGLGQLCHLDYFSASAANALDPGLFERLRIAGIAMECDDRGTLRIIRPVREVLKQTIELDASAARRIAQPLLHAGLPLDAVRALLRTDQTDQAAHMLSTLSAVQVDMIPSHDLIVVLEMTAPLADSYPRLELVKARALGNAARLGEQLDALHNAIGIATVDDDRDLMMEAIAESLYVRATIGDDADACQADLDEFIKSLNDTTTSTVMARVHDARGMLLAQSDKPAVLLDALVWSRQATDEWLALGDQTRATSSIRTRIMLILLRLGRMGEADRDLQRVMALPQITMLERLSNLVVATQIDALLGRRGQQAISEAASLAEALQADWAAGYVCWSRMIQESLSPVDPVAVQLNYEAAWELLGGIRHRGTAVALRADAVEALARVNRMDVAAETLALMTEALGPDDPDVLLARLAYGAYAGDCVSVDMIVRSLDEGEVAPAWRVSALAAVAAQRSNADDLSDRILRAQASARDAGCESALNRVWPELLGVAANGAAPQETFVPSDQSVDAVASSGPHSIEIQVLGGFGLHIDGNPVKIRSQNVAIVMKTLALGQRRAVVDVIIDRLWPDADLETGRRRLKNVLARCRDVLGDVIRRERDVIVLDDSVRIDLIDFRHSCQAALHDLARDNMLGVPSGLAAVRLYRGELLPDDLYDDDIAPLRLSEAQRATAVVDSIMSRSSNASVVAAVLDAILRIAPDDEIRLGRFQRWAEQCGQPQVAAAARPLTA